MDTFIEDSTYDNLVAALVTVEPSPYTGSVTRDEIIWALAEVAWIFPARIEAISEAANGRS